MLLLIPVMAPMMPESKSRNRLQIVGWRRSFSSWDWARLLCRFKSTVRVEVAVAGRRRSMNESWELRAMSGECDKIEIVPQYSDGWLHWSLGVGGSADRFSVNVGIEYIVVPASHHHHSRLPTVCLEWLQEIDFSGCFCPWPRGIWTSLLFALIYNFLDSTINSFKGPSIN